MKVILTAFNRKLIARKPIDWPDDKKGQDIYIMMDMDRLKMGATFTKAAEFDSVVKRAKFVPTGGHTILSNGLSGEEYKLVDVS
jgi:hypothetical protein